MLVKVKKDTNNSLKLLQEYSIKNNIGDFDGLLPQLETNELDNFKTYQSLQNKTDDLNDDLINEGYETSRYQTNFAKLYELQSLFLEKSAYLKPNTTYLITLKKRIDTLKKSLNRPQEVLPI